jgi:hypothetical protein
MRPKVRSAFQRYSQIGYRGFLSETQTEPMKRPGSLRQKEAESLAIQALAFIAGDSARIGPFLAATGIGPEMIRAAAREPDFLRGVLDYVAGDDGLLVAFATETGINPFDIPIARDALAPAPKHRD